MKNVEFLEQLKEFEVDFPELHEEEEEEYLEMDIFNMDEINQLLKQNLKPIKDKKHILLKQSIPIEEIFNQKLNFEKMDELRVIIDENFKKLSELFLSDFDPKSLLSLFTDSLKKINHLLNSKPLFNKFLECYIEPFLFFFDAFQTYQFCNQIINSEDDLFFKIENQYIEIIKDSLINKQAEILKFKNLKIFNENFYISSNLKLILSPYLLYQGDFKIKKKYINNIMLLSKDSSIKDENEEHFISVYSKFTFLNLFCDFEEIEKDSFYNLDLLVLVPNDLEYEIQNDKFMNFKINSSQKVNKIYWIKK